MIVTEQTSLIKMILEKCNIKQFIYKPCQILKDSFVKKTTCILSFILLLHKVYGASYCELSAQLLEHTRSTYTRKIKASLSK